MSFYCACGALLNNGESPAQKEKPDHRWPGFLVSRNPIIAAHEGANDSAFVELSTPIHTDLFYCGNYLTEYTAVSLPF